MISITSHNKISYYCHQGAIRHEDINVGSRGDTGIPSGDKITMYPLNVRFLFMNCATQVG